MKNKIMTADEIFEKTMKNVAPLPCQEPYARELSSIFAYHLRKNALIDSGFSSENLPYQGAVVVAPTGAGKTYLLKATAKVLKVNTIIIDCGSLCKDGWKGPSFSQQLLAAKNAAESKESFDRSILFLDEFDKLKLYHGINDEGNPMDNLLQLYNGGKVAAESGNREVEYIDVSRFTIILGGAFSGLEKIIQERIAPHNKIGFGIQNDTKKHDIYYLLKHANPDDLEKYGIKKELISRISSIISINPMQLEDYKCLLTAESGSIQDKYKNYFTFGCGVDFEITDKAISFIANECLKGSTGARATNPIINDIMRKGIIEVDRDQTVNKVYLDADNGGCFLRYEHGERSFNSIENNTKSNEAYFIVANSISSIVSKLCSFYKKAECDAEYGAEFKTFAHLALTYLRYNTRSSDFCYNSLLKLSQAVGKENSSQTSPFDIMMSDAIQLPTHHNDIDKYYEKFKKCWDSETMYRLNKSLAQIGNYLTKQYHSFDIKFKVDCFKC